MLPTENKSLLLLLLLLLLLKNVVVLINCMTVGRAVDSMMSLKCCHQSSNFRSLFKVYRISFDG